MIRKFVAVAALAVVLAPFAVHAAEKTVPLTVQNAYCELCPSMVKKSLSQVSGVKAVRVTKPNQAGDMTATVTFDDATTSVPALIAATTNAGYPSHVTN